MAFAECMADALPLRETASRVGVSLYTAWFMVHTDARLRGHGEPHAGVPRGDVPRGRHARDGQPQGQPVQVRLPAPDQAAPPQRARRQAGRRRAVQGVGRRRCGVNELGDCFCDVCGRGSEAAGELAMALCSRIPEGSSVVTDGRPSYRFAAAGWRHAVVGPKDPSTGDINMVNALHSRLKAFLARFNGVSTRRLQRYLDWFRYAECFKGGGMDRRERLYMHEAEGRYWKTREYTHCECGDVMVYWTRRIAAMSTVV